MSRTPTAADPSTGGLVVADRTKQLTTAAVDPTRGRLSRQMSAEEVQHHSRRDNPGAIQEAIEAAAGKLFAAAGTARH